MSLLLIATLILSATRAAIALNHNNDYSASPDSKMWRLEKRRSLQKDSLVASSLDHNDYSVIADRREIIQSNKIKSRSVPSESPQLSLDQESIMNEQSYHRNELVVPTFTSTDVSSELDIPTFSIYLFSSNSSSSINEEMKDEITRGTQEYLENILEGSSFASDGMGAFEGIEVTLESIQEVNVGGLVDGSGERRRKMFVWEDHNELYHDGKKRRTLLRNTEHRISRFIDNGNNSPDIGSLQQHAIYMGSRKLRQRHHDEPTTENTIQNARSNDPVEVVLTFSAVAKFSQPLDPTRTNGNELVLYFSKVMEKEDKNGAVIDEGSNHVGYVGLMKKRFQSMDEEGASDALIFWENVSSISMTKVGNEPPQGDTETLINTETLPNAAEGNVLASILEKNDGTSAQASPNLAVTYKPNNDNENEIEDLSTTSLPNDALYESPTSPSSPAPLTPSNQDQNDETKEEELNLTKTTPNPKDITKPHSKSILAKPLPLPTPKEEDIDNKSQKKKIASITLGVSSIAVILAVFIAFFFLRRWERNVNMIEYTGRDLDSDNPPALSPPSSPDNNSVKHLQEKENSTGMNSVSLTSDSLVIAAGAKQDMAEDHEESSTATSIVSFPSWLFSPNPSSPWWENSDNQKPVQYSRADEIHCFTDNHSAFLMPFPEDEHIFKKR